MVRSSKEVHKRPPTDTRYVKVKSVSLHCTIDVLLGVCNFNKLLASIGASIVMLGTSVRSVAYVLAEWASIIGRALTILISLSCFVSLFVCSESAVILRDMPSTRATLCRKNDRAHPGSWPWLSCVPLWWTCRTQIRRGLLLT